MAKAEILCIKKDLSTPVEDLAMARTASIPWRGLNHGALETILGELKRLDTLWVSLQGNVKSSTSLSDLMTMRRHKPHPVGTQKPECSFCSKIRKYLGTAMFTARFKDWRFLLPADLSYKGDVVVIRSRHSALAFSRVPAMKGVDLTDDMAATAVGAGRVLPHIAHTGSRCGGATRRSVSLTTQGARIPRVPVGSGPRVPVGSGPHVLVGSGPRVPVGSGPRVPAGSGPRIQASCFFTLVHSIITQTSCADTRHPHSEQQCSTSRPFR